MSQQERLRLLTTRLRNGEAATVATLADELAVSRRTLLRDLAHLREAGMVVEGAPGPGGGIFLRDDRGLAAVHFSVAEIVSLWLSTTLAHASSQLPWGHATKSAMNKLMASLPLSKANNLRALCRRVVIGDPADERVRLDAKPPPNELMRVFEAAFSGRNGMAFGYTDARGRRSQRRIEPHGLLVQTPVWYVLAMDLDKREPRSFRMDRIQRARADGGDVCAERSCDREADATLWLCAEAYVSEGIGFNETTQPRIGWRHKVGSRHQVARENFGNSVAFRHDGRELFVEDPSYTQGFGEGRGAIFVYAR